MIKKKNSFFNTNIHGLRGIAVLFIFLFHTYVVIVAAGNTLPANVVWLERLFNVFDLGVDIFFMISGYLITASLIRHKDAKAFLIDRLIRIYPVFITAECLLFLIAPHLHYKWTVGLTPLQMTGNFISNILLLPGVFPLPRILGTAWSLSYELLFYIYSAGFYFFWFRKRIFSYIILFLIVPWILYLFPHMIGFVTGIIVYFLINSQNNEATFNIVKNVLVRKSNFIGTSAFVLYCFIMSGNVDSHFTGSFAGQGVDWLNIMFSDAVVPNRYEYIITYLAAIPGMLFFIQVAYGSRFFSALLNFRFFQYMGSISYSFYIWHWPILAAIKSPIFNVIMHKFNLPFFIAYLIFSLLSFLVVVTVAQLSNYYLEKKSGLFLKKYFSIAH